MFQCCETFYFKEAEEISRLEAELAALPTEEELEQREEELRPIQKEIDDFDKQIEEANTFLMEHDDIDTLQQKIREEVQSIAKLQAEKRADEAEGITPVMPKPKRNPTKARKTTKVILFQSKSICSYFK